MDLNQLGSYASIISLIIGLFLGGGATHIYHTRIKANIKLSNFKNNIAKVFCNKGSINQENK